MGRAQMNFRVALLQIAPFGNDQNRNLAKGLECCRAAKAAGADLAGFPELWNIGCTLCPIDADGRRSWAAAAIDQRSEFFQTFAALARELSMSIALTYLETHQPKPRNTVSIISGRGEVALNYSKVFICSEIVCVVQKFRCGILNLESSVAVVRPRCALGGESFFFAPGQSPRMSMGQSLCLCACRARGLQARAPSPELPSYGVISNTVPWLPMPKFVVP
jgi:hypothetical protein